MDFGRQVMRQILEGTDQKLRETRDKKRYRCKGKKKNCIKTRFGEVEFSRNVYLDKSEASGKHCRFLLDEHLDLESNLCGQMSEEICQMAVEASCTQSYREAAKAITGMTGLTISAQSVWKLVQEKGEHRREQLKRFKELDEMGAGPGAIQSEILYEENDGVLLSLQKEDRRKFGRKKELKVGTAYDGVTWARMKDGKKRRELHDKVAYASFEKAEEYRQTKEGLIASEYDTSCVKLRVIGGDGAGWTLKPSVKPAVLKEGGETVITVLDRFHRNKKITECVQDEEFSALLRKKLNEKEVDTVLDLIEARINSTEAETEKTKLRELFSYFKENKDSLLGYYDRGIAIPDTVEPGVVHHALLGSMESNIFTLIGNRMKDRRHCWSVNGAANLAVLLCLKHTAGFDALRCPLVPLPEPLAVEPDVPNPPPMSASSVPETVGKGSEYYCNVSLSDIPWLRDIAADNTLDDIRFG